jgi:hypothetical protein
VKFVADDYLLSASQVLYDGHPRRGYFELIMHYGFDDYCQTS